MDQYIRDFTVNTVETFTLRDCEEFNKIMKVNNEFSNFKIVHNNIRSINKNFDEFRLFLSNIDSDVDCVVLTETWIVDDPELFNITGYNLFYNEGRLNQNDGTFVYVRSEYNCTCKIIPIKGIKTIRLTVELEADNTLQITALYRPPSTDVYEFNKGLQEYMQENNDKNNYSIFVGDINVDIMSSTDYTNEYLSILNEFGYTSVINGHTRVQGATATCIDHIFVRSRYDILSNMMPLIVETDITDHYTIALQMILDFNKNRPLGSRARVRLDHDRLVIAARNISWHDLTATRDPDEATNRFVGVIMRTIEECSYTVHAKRKISKIAPWITKGLVKSIHIKNQLFRNLKKHPDNDELKRRYKNYRNKLTNLIRRTKYEYYQQQIKASSSDTKTLWKIVQEITHTGKNKHEISVIMSEKSGELTDRKQVADEFNQVYSQMGKKMADAIKRDPMYIPRRPSSSGSFVLLPTDKDEVGDLISGLKSHRSAGVDEIQVDALKTLSPFIQEPLSYIINMCLKKGVWPRAFKETVIIPIFKGGNDKLITNYRPITLITHLSKIMERVLKKRLSAYIAKYKFLSDKQFGFREGVSTEDALLSMTSMVSTALDEGKPSLCMFVDLSKAFDTVSHDLLLQTLEDVGIRSGSLSLFKSYLTGRSQSVRVDSVMSDRRGVEFGIPQGTVLGPLLFSIYINGLFNVRCGGEVLGFADDIVVFYKADTWENLRTIVETGFPQLKNWLEHKLLTVNLKKTSYLPFSCNRSGTPSFRSINITTIGEQCTILPEEKVKYLGVMVDCNLKWNEHIQFVCNKLRTILHKFKYLKSLLTVHQLKILYHALVESHLRYGIVCWGNALKTHILKLEVLQKRFLKTILGKDPRYPSDSLFLEAHVFDIRQLYYFSVTMKYRCGEKSSSLPVHSYETRGRKLFILPRVQKCVGQRSFSYTAPRLYNFIPQEIQHITGLSRFRSRLREFIMTQRRGVFADLVELRS